MQPWHVHRGVFALLVLSSLLLVVLRGVDQIWVLSLVVIMFHVVGTSAFSGALFRSTRSAVLGNLLVLLGSVVIASLAWSLHAPARPQEASVGARTSTPAGP